MFLFESVCAFVHFTILAISLVVTETKRLWSYDMGAVELFPETDEVIGQPSVCVWIIFANLSVNMDFLLVRYISILFLVRQCSGSYSWLHFAFVIRKQFENLTITNILNLKGCYTNHTTEHIFFTLFFRIRNTLSVKFHYLILVRLGLIYLREKKVQDQSFG